MPSNDGIKGMGSTDFVVGEIMDSHAAMTKAQVPTHNEHGDAMSLSERVGMLCSAFAGLALSTAVITKAREGSVRR